MTDIVEQLRAQPHILGPLYAEAADEIERLQELLRGVGANRYWEGRWREAVAEIERLRAEVEWHRALLGAIRADERYRRLRIRVREAARRGLKE